MSRARTKENLGFFPQIDKVCLATWKNQKWQNLVPKITIIKMLVYEQ